MSTGYARRVALAYLIGAMLIIIGLALGPAFPLVGLAVCFGTAGFELFTARKSRKKEELK